MAAEPGGDIGYWHVDGVAATFERLVAMGAKEDRPVTPAATRVRDGCGVDPFGNVLGITYDPHDLEILQSSGRA